MLEAQLEAYFRKRCRLALGGVVVKIAPTLVGVPDRLVILPEGRIFLVELKTKSGRLSPAQTAFHLKVQKLGSPVFVLFGKDEVDDWVSARATDILPEDIENWVTEPAPRYVEEPGVPAEPPIGSVVRDKYGVLVTRADNGRWGSSGMLPLAIWEPMYLSRGPLEIVSTPAVEGVTSVLPICSGCGFAMTADTCGICA